MGNTRLLFPTVLVVVLSIACWGSVGVVTAADSGMPGEPASFYGNAIDANGTEIPVGATIVAVVNGSVEDEITVETPGEYGGSSTFDDKLRVDSAAGEEVTFHLGGPNGSVGKTVALEPGLSEVDLTFPEGAIGELPPNPEIDLDPATADAGESIAFSANESSARGDADLVAFEWSIERDGEPIAAFDGETRTEQIDETGEYDVVLTVTDTNGKTASETSTLEIEDGETDGSTGSGGGGTGGTMSLGGSGGGTGAGTTGADGSGTDGETEPESTGGSGSGSGLGSGTTPDSSKPTLEPIFAETHRIEDRFPDSPGTAVVFGETAINEIVLKNRSVGGEISIEEFDGPTGDAPPIPGAVRIASVSEITVPDEHRNSDALLRTVVSDGWLAGHGIDPADLTVYRLPDGGDQWEALPTDAYEIEGGYAVEAETPGFSQFVVAGRVPPDRRDGRSATTEGGTDSSLDESEATGSGSTDAKTSTLDGETSIDPTSPIVPLAFLCALLVVVAAVGRLFIPRRRERW